MSSIQQSKQNFHTNGASMRSDSSTKPDFMTFLARHWRRVCVFAITGTILLALFSYTRPQTFVATTTVLPPEHEGMGGLLSFLASSSSASAALNLLGSDIGANPTLELFKTIIESRSIAEDVASDSVIYAYFHRRDTSQKGIINTLNGSIQAEALRTGMLAVSVKVAAPRFASHRELDSTRKMAAFVTNAFVSALDRFNRDRLMTTAKEIRIFVQDEYDRKMKDLDTAYQKLQAFQDSNGAISLPDQLKATVSAAAELASKMEQNEMERKVEERELGPDNPRMQALTAEYEAEQQALNKYDSGGAGEYILALKQAPELSRELAGYLREVKLLEQVTAYLRSELEQERIAERRDLPSLQVLDAAVAPSGPASPNRKLFAIVGLILGGIVGIVLTELERFYLDVKARPRLHYRLVNVLKSVRYGSRAELLEPFAPQTSSGIPSVSEVPEEQSNI